jgi:flagellar FliL protein
VLVVNSLILVGVAGLVALRRPAAEGGSTGESASGEGGAKGPGPTLKLSDFTVRLRDKDGEHFARISFDIEIAAEKDRDYVMQMTPQVRDAFISYLADRTREDFEGSAAIQKTKQALTERLSSIVGPKARALYISELVLQ